MEHFFIFPYIGNNHPNCLIFFRGVETTNQICIWTLKQISKNRRVNLGKADFSLWTCHGHKTCTYMHIRYIWFVVSHILYSYFQAHLGWRLPLTVLFFFLGGLKPPTTYVYIYIYIYIHTYAVDVLETIGVSDLGIHFIKRSVSQRLFHCHQGGGDRKCTSRMCKTSWCGNLNNIWTSRCWPRWAAKSGPTGVGGEIWWSFQRGWSSLSDSGEYSHYKESLIISRKVALVVLPWV